MSILNRNINEIYDNIKTSLKLLVSDVDARYIFRELKASNPEDINILIFNLNAIIKSNSTLNPSKRLLAQMALCSKSHASRVIKYGKRRQRKVGRPPTLSNAQEKILIDIIINRFKTGIPMEQKEISSFIYEKFRLRVSRCYIYSFLSRYSDFIRKTLASPIEFTRMKVNPKDILNYYSILAKELKDIPADLIFNLDETGIGSWQNLKKKLVIVPKDICKKDINYSYRRYTSRFTIMPCINAIGNSLTPLLITQRKTLDKDFFSSGIILGEEIVIKSQKSAFITERILLEWINEVLIPQVQGFREAIKMYESDAVLICDNFVAHTTNSIKKRLAEFKIKLITIVPHSSHLTQPLDLVTFRCFKNTINNNILGKKGITQTQQIRLILDALETSTITHNNQSAFARAGIDIVPIDERYYIQVNNEKIQEIISNLEQQNAFDRNEEAELVYQEVSNTHYGFINKELKRKQRGRPRAKKDNK